MHLFQNIFQLHPTKVLLGKARQSFVRLLSRRLPGLQPEFQLDQLEPAALRALPDHEFFRRPYTDAKTISDAKPVAESEFHRPGPR